MVSVEGGILLKYVVNLSACGLGTEAVLWLYVQVFS